MFNDLQLKAIRTAIAFNELGNQSPYVLSFARLGSSGASFGTFQADTHTNPLARAVLTQVLRVVQLDDVAIGRIIDALSQPCPAGDPLTPADASAVNSALSSPAGVRIVDAMDNQLLQTVLTRTQEAMDTIAAKGWTADTTVVLYIALWVNMTGAPDLLCRWIKGQTVFGLRPPLGPVFAQSDIETYLKATTYFQLHPKNFDHFELAVAAGAKVLQAGAGV